MSLSEKEKELVAIGASIGGNCIPCLEWHYKRCLELGFTKEQMRLAFAMAKKVKETPNKKIYETADQLIGKNELENETSDCGCGGGC
jgi:4-carboxymuconolactone decarboxylase